MKRYRYEVWKDGEEIAGPMFTGSLSECTRYAIMMGGKNWKSKGYHIGFAIG